MIETHDPSSRWSVIRIDHNEQEKGGAFGKRYVVATVLTREFAEGILSTYEEDFSRMKRLGSKNDFSFVLEEVG